MKVIQYNSKPLLNMASHKANNKKYNFGLIFIILVMSSLLYSDSLLHNVYGYFVDYSNAYVTNSVDSFSLLEECPIMDGNPELEQLMHFWKTMLGIPQDVMYKLDDLAKKILSRYHYDVLGDV